MTDLRQAAKMVLRSLKEFESDGHIVDGITLGFSNEIVALEKALAEWKPDDTAYRPDGLSMPIDRGAWSGVEDATKWVDELRGGDKQCSSCGGFCNGVCERENVKSNLLNQTCCGCGRSGGYALYCGWCWDKGEHVADVNTSEERVPILDKQRQWVGLTTEQRNNIMQKYGNDWKRYIEEVERQLQENNS